MTKNVKTKNNAGSALLYVLILMVVGTVIVTAVLTVSVSFALKAANQGQEGQAYYSAKGVCDAIAYELLSDTESPIRSEVEIKLAQVGNQIIIEDVVLPAEDMGTVKESFIERVSENQIVITSTVVLKEEESTVTVVLKENKTELVAAEEMFAGIDMVTAGAGTINASGSDMMIRTSPTTLGTGVEPEYSTYTTDNLYIMENTPQTYIASTWNVKDTLFTTTGGMKLVQAKEIEGTPFLPTTLTLGSKEYKIDAGQESLSLAVGTADIEEMTTEFKEDEVRKAPQWSWDYENAIKLDSDISKFLPGNYYEVTSNYDRNLDSLMGNVTAENPVIIIVREDVTLDVSVDSWGESGDDSPRVLFYLEEGASLEIPNNTVIGVYGEKESSLIVPAGNSKIYGQISVDTIALPLEAKMEYEYKAINIANYYKKNIGEKLYVGGWEKEGYIGGYYEK